MLMVVVVMRTRNGGDFVMVVVVMRMRNGGGDDDRMNAV